MGFKAKKEVFVMARTGWKNFVLKVVSVLMVLMIFTAGFYIEITAQQLCETDRPCAYIHPPNDEIDG